MALSIIVLLLLPLLAESKINKICTKDSQFKDVCHDQGITCETKDGVIDLSPMKSLSPLKASGLGASFDYHPITPFTKTNCKSVLMCEKSAFTSGAVVAVPGEVRFSQCGGGYVLRYRAKNIKKSADVYLTCNNRTTAPTSALYYMGMKPSNHYEFELQSEYACPKQQITTQKTTMSSPKRPTKPSTKPPTKPTTPPTHKSTKIITTRKSTPGKTTPSKTTPKSTPAKTTPPKTTPEKTTPKKTTPKKTTPKKTTPKKTTPKKTTPQRTTPKKTTPRKTTPVKTSAKTTPVKTTPAKTSPKKTTQSKTTPRKTTPVKTSPKSTPKKTTQGKTTPQKTTARKTTPQKPTPAKSTTPNTPKTTPSATSSFCATPALIIACSILALRRFI